MSTVEFDVPVERYMADVPLFLSYIGREIRNLLRLIGNGHYLLDNPMLQGVDIPENLYRCRFILESMKELPRNRYARSIRDTYLIETLAVSIKYFTVCNSVCTWEPITFPTIRGWANLSPVDPVVSYAYDKANSGLNELNIPLNLRDESLWPGALTHRGSMREFWFALFETFKEGRLVID